MFIFSSEIEAIEVEQTKLNCPYPINAGIATLGLIQNFPNVNYTISYDNDTSGDEYHVTLFNCTEDSVTHEPAVNTIVYTAEVGNNWFDFTNRASGYMFYISQSITAFFQKLVALGALIYLIMFPISQIASLSFFAYIQIVLYGFVALGLFLVIRG